VQSGPFKISLIPKGSGKPRGVVSAFPKAPAKDDAEHAAPTSKKPEAKGAAPSAGDAAKKAKV
jgi:hypothetical protein